MRDFGFDSVSSGGGGSTLPTLPTPIVNLGRYDSNNIQSLYAHYLPNTNGGNDFLNYEPMYYLFMAKSRVCHYKKGKGKVIRTAGFYHPTHLNGINFPPNTAYYGGKTEIPIDSEFNIDNVPYKKTLIGINPFQWARFKIGGFWIVPTLANFGLIVSNYKIQGKKSKQTAGQYQRSALMYLVIGIKNPDLSSKYPILFGQPSNLFRISLSVIKGVCVGLQYTIQHSSVKRNIP